MVKTLTELYEYFGTSGIITLICLWIFIIYCGWWLIYGGPHLPYKD